MRRSPAGASASSRPSPGASASSRPAPGPSARSRPAQGASTSSRPSQGASTSSRPAPGASARSRQASGTFTRSQPVKGASASSRPGQEAPARSRSPLRASTRRRPVPGDSARSQPARSRSPLGASSRYQPASGASTRSRPVPGGSASSQPAQGASSRNSIRNEAGSRAQPSNRSPSPQGATSRSPSPQGATSRSPSPQGATSRSPSPQRARSRSCPKISKKSDKLISPVNINESSENLVDVQPKTLSSHALPDKLYGVKVSNFPNALKNITLKSFLTERFMLYGNVFCVTLHRSSRDSYALVFYKEKHEQEKALTADTNGPLGFKFSVTLWSGPPPDIFGIMVTNIDNDSDLSDRIRSEFGKFGDVTIVQIRGSKRQRVALVFYKNRKDQEKALASPNPRKTSFGEVTVTAWNKPPTTWGEMASYEFSWAPTPQGATSRCLSPQGAPSSSQACSKTCDKSNSQISPPVPMNKSNGDVGRQRPTGVDVQHTTLSSPELPGSLYGVQVSKLDKHLKNKYLKSFLTDSFMLYGNVVCVTMHGADKDRYGLVFYKQKLEREKALTADVYGPLGKKLCVASWSGASPCIFGIVVTSIDNNAVDLPDRIKSELGIFGAVSLVQIRGPTHQRFAFVFYKYQKGQKRALASRNPLKTSFGEVSVSPWNKPPPTCKECRDISNADIIRLSTCSPVVSMLGKEGSPQPPASVRNWPPEAVQAPMWNGPQVALPPPVCDRPFVAIQPRRMSPYIEMDYENRKMLYSPSLRSDSPHALSRRNRSRSPIFASAQIRTRRSRSRSPYFSMPKNTSPTRSRYSRCQSPHSNLAISTSPLTRARYSRSLSPCSYQLHSEHWPTSEIRPRREHRRAGQADMSSSLQKSSLILWINNLEETTSRAELCAAFTPFGEIKQIEIKEGFRNNGKQAFLQYSHPSCVTRAIDQMDGAFFLDRKLQVDFAYPQQATNCLWVYGLNFAHVTEQYLTQVFKEFGHVQKMLHDPVKGAALVLYSDATSAVNAINMKTIGGHSVRLGFANRRCQLGFCHSMESSGQDVGAFFRMCDKLM